MSVVRFPQCQVSGCGVWHGCPTDGSSPVFSTPVPLSSKVATGPSAVPLPPLIHRFPPPPIASHPSPCRNQALLDCMQCLMRAGAHRLDALRASQLVVQEASRVMAVAMLQQQGTMWEVTTWESEVDDEGNGTEGGWGRVQLVDRIKLVN